MVVTRSTFALSVLAYLVAVTAGDEADVTQCEEACEAVVRGCVIWCIALAVLSGAQNKGMPTIYCSVIVPAECVNHADFTAAENG